MDQVTKSKNAFFRSKIVFLRIGHDDEDELSIQKIIDTWTSFENNWAHKDGKATIPEGKKLQNCK